MALGRIVRLQSSNNDLELTLSKNFININKGESTTVTVNTPSDGKIYVTSSDSTRVTVSINNNIITINAIKYGSAIIYIGQDTGTGNYTNITSKISQLFVLISLVPKSTLNDNDWEIISQISQEGIGVNYWSVGDIKSITLNGTIGTLTLNNFVTNIFILHFNYSMNGVVENNIIWGGFKDSSRIGIALVDSKYNNNSTDGTMYFNMNHWGNKNYGGWKGSDLRYDILGATSIQPSDYGTIHTTACVGYDATSATLTNPTANTLLAALPADFRNSLRLWSRWIDAVGNGSNIDANIKETIDAVTLLAEFEVFGTRQLANEYEQNYQSQMEYYRLGNSRIKYKHNNSSSSVWWWLASHSYSSSSSVNFRSVATNGNTNYGYAYRSGAIAPAFKT